MSQEKYPVTTILFDFDGTIADTFKELVKIYNKIAPSLNCKPMADIDIPTLRNKRPQDFMKEYNISKLNLPLLVIKGRKELKKKIHEIQPFDNLIITLEELKKRNLKLGILSSNSQNNIRKFLINNNINHLFDFVYNGKNLFGKSKRISKIIKDQGIEKHQMLMVGDETRDIEAAKKLHIKIIAVSWGFNKKEVLQKLNPNFIAEKPEDLLTYAIQLSR
jgi:phosphoglycolate phosphatase